SATGSATIRIERIAISFVMTASFHEAMSQVGVGRTVGAAVVIAVLNPEQKSSTCEESNGAGARESRRRGRLTTVPSRPFHARGRDGPVRESTRDIASSD